MAQSLEIRDGDKCIAYLVVKDVSKVTWKVRENGKFEDIPEVPTYTKAKNVQPFWLFVKNIEYHFNISQSKAKSMADKIWPESCDREYIKIAKRIKSEIRDIGWSKIEQCNALSAETLVQIQELHDAN